MDIEPARDGPMPADNEIGPEDIWKEPIDRLFTRLQTSRVGLTTTEVQSRLTTYGRNAAASARHSPLWLQFLTRFRNPLVIILLVASGLSAATGDVASFFIVVTIVTLRIMLDFIQEVRAQSAVDALRRSVAVQANALRDGASLSVPIDQLVPGDIVELIAGDLVPADSRLLESRDLFVNQALLTGEESPIRPKSRPTMLPWAQKIRPEHRTPYLPAPPSSVALRALSSAERALERHSGISQRVWRKSRRPLLLPSAFAVSAC
jgi:Mg2+-importing ATPase